MKKPFLTFLSLIFRQNCEDACSVIHFRTNQMQIQFKSENKNGTTNVYALRSYGLLIHFFHFFFFTAIVWCVGVHILF